MIIKAKKKENELIGQIRSGDILADVDVALEGDPLAGEQAQAPRHHLLAQLHAGDAVLQQPARAVVALEHCHRVTRLGRTNILSISSPLGNDNISFPLVGIKVVTEDKKRGHCSQLIRTRC